VHAVYCGRAVHTVE